MTIDPAEIRRRHLALLQANIITIFEDYWKCDPAERCVLVVASEHGQVVQRRFIPYYMLKAAIQAVDVLADINAKLNEHTGKKDIVTALFASPDEGFHVYAFRADTSG